MSIYQRFGGWAAAGVLLWSGLSILACSATPPPATDAQPKAEETPKPTPEKPPLTAAFESASNAAEMAQTAVTPEQWSAVASAWAEAIQALQAVPADSPQWLFAQRKTREYLANQEIALQRVEQSARLAIFPTLGNDILDEQLGLYLSYVSTFGTPDILVIGSSRALQGLNPQILQQRLTQQGLDSPTVYTFAVNGATAQVMSFVLRQLLTPEQMPRMIVWAGGSRSFNSGRFDRTFAKILESPGYAAVQAGDRPSFDSVELVSTTRPVADNAGGNVPISAINGYGFLAVSDVFEPNVYYRNFPRVPGRYDSSYEAFNLEGVQAVSFRAIADFARSNEIPLVFVNLPLSTDYLDETRLFYERQFQQFLATEASARDFIVVDLLQEWPENNHFFADPSHLNQIGATQVAIAVAESDLIPWNLLNHSEEDVAEDTEVEAETEPGT